MHVFVIPSWYPSPAHPHYAVFCKEQVEALARCLPNTMFSVSLWGQEEFYLTPKSPLRSLRRIGAYAHRERRGERAQSENWGEFSNKAFEWSYNLAGGNLSSLLAANRDNLRRAEKRFGPVSLFHAHVSYPAGRIAMILAEKRGVPYIITEHMSRFPFPKYMRNDELVPEFDAPLKKAACVIAVSPAARNRIASFGIENVRWIPNLVDESRFKPTNEKHDRPECPFRFFTLAQLTWKKGIDTLIQAIAKVQFEDQPVEFRIGGEGPNEREYRRLAQTLGVPERLRWLGPLNRDRVVEEMQSADAFVLPSRHESFGIVFAEAAACGKPAIATRCGGPECILSPDTGVLIPPGDVNALAAAIRSILIDHQRFDPKTIRAHYLRRFSRPAVCALIAEVYREVSGNDPGRLACEIPEA